MIPKLFLVNMDDEKKIFLNMGLVNEKIILHEISNNSNLTVDKEWFMNNKIEPLKDWNGMLMCSTDKFKEAIKGIGSKYFKVGEKYINNQKEYILEEDINAYRMIGVNNSSEILLGNLDTFVPGIANDGLQFMLSV